jgi:hypothetical protein
MIILLCLVVISMSCSDANKSQSHIGAGTWDSAIHQFALKTGELRLANELVDGADATVDFFSTCEEWFAAIISVRNDTACAFQGYIGRLEQYSIGFTFLTDVIELRDQEYRLYLSRLAHDSLWVYIAESDFRLDRNGIESRCDQAQREGPGAQEWHRTRVLNIP